MKFNALPTTDINFDGDTMIHGKTARPCFNCHTLTNWVSISFEAHICSEECNTKVWKDYQEACQKTSEKAKSYSLEW